MVDELVRKLYNALHNTQLAMVNTQICLSETAASGWMSVGKARSASKFTLLWDDRLDTGVLTSKEMPSKQRKDKACLQVSHNIAA